MIEKPGKHQAKQLKMLLEDHVIVYKPKKKGRKIRIWEYYPELKKKIWIANTEKGPRFMYVQTKVGKEIVTEQGVKPTKEQKEFLIKEEIKAIKDPVKFFEKLTQDTEPGDKIILIHKPEIPDKGYHLQPSEGWILADYVEPRALARREKTWERKLPKDVRRITIQATEKECEGKISHLDAQEAKIGLFEYLQPLLIRKAADQKSIRELFTNIKDGHISTEPMITAKVRENRAIKTLFKKLLDLANKYDTNRANWRGK